MKNAVISLVFQLVAAISFAQEPITPNPDTFYRYDVDLEKYFSLLAGSNVWTYHYAEAGIALHESGVVGHHPYAWAVFMSSEVRIGNKFIFGPKVGAWASGGAGAMAMGINAIYYTDRNTGSFRIRPEIGIGVQHFKIVYGYNITITGKEFIGANKHNVSLGILFGLIKLRTIQRNWPELKENE